MPNKKKTGFLPFLPLLCALPGAVAAILGLFLPYADRLTKQPYTDTVDRQAMTLSEWGKQHDMLRELGEKGFPHFETARTFAWVIAIASVAVLVLLLYSRLDRTKGVFWVCAGAGALLALASVLAFLFAVFFSVGAGNENKRVLLSVAPYCTLAGGLLVGAVTFFAVRRDL